MAVWQLFYKHMGLPSLGVVQRAALPWLPVGPEPGPPALPGTTWFSTTLPKRCGEACTVPPSCAFK